MTYQVLYKKFLESQKVVALVTETYEAEGFEVTHDGSLLLFQKNDGNEFSNLINSHAFPPGVWMGVEPAQAQLEVAR